MTEFEILEEIELTSGTNDKKTILKAHKDHDRLGELLNAVFNFFKKYHIKKVDIVGFNEQSEDKHIEFMLILQALEGRHITGQLAKTTVENFLNDCNILQQKWYTRVIQKDMKMGVSVNTAQSCGFKIPKFDVMLAKDAKKMKKAKSVVEKGVFVSPKYDGYRCLMIFDGQEVNLYSRNGSNYENFPELHKSLSEALIGKAEPVVLDGEIMSDDFQSMQKSAFASVRGTTVGDMVYHVFGIIPYSEWVADDFQMNTRQRLAYLEEDYARHFCETPNVVIVNHIYTEDWEEILTLEAKYLEQGLEGAMALPADMPYYKGRKTNALMKFKTFHSEDCVIDSFEEGTGKFQGMLGAVKVLQEDGTTICGVGSGFTDADRQYIWNNQDQVKGRIIEVRYQEKTDDGVMRFPTFVRFRDSGNGDGKI